MPLAIREYIAPNGRSPFREWLMALDMAARARIQARILRFETGNLGDHKSLGSGIWEARVMFGPGYRVYFGKDGDALIVLLARGAKSTQARDVDRAQAYWRDYREARRHGTT